MINVSCGIGIQVSGIISLRGGWKADGYNDRLFVWRRRSVFGDSMCFSFFWSFFGTFRFFRFFFAIFFFSVISRFISVVRVSTFDLVWFGIFGRFSRWVFRFTFGGGVVVGRTWFSTEKYFVCFGTFRVCMWICTCLFFLKQGFNNIWEVDLLGLF